MSNKLQNIKFFSISDILKIISSEKEIIKHANGSFGFDEEASYLENAFISGAEHIRQELYSKLENHIIDEWHNSESKISLREYLGMNEKEYEYFLKGR